MVRTKTYCFIVFLCISFLTNAQDPYLSTRAATPLFFNPAYAGNEYYTRATLNYRNHYPASGTAFATYSASFDKYFDRYNSGFGVALTSDQFGSKSYSYTSAGLVYSYKIPSGLSNHFKVGLMANLYYGTNNPNDLLFPDMINPDGTEDLNRFTYERQSAFGVDFGFGGLFVSDYFEAGAAVYHLGKEDKNVYWSRPLRIYAHAEWEIPILSSAKYTPSRGVARYFENSALKPSVFFVRQANVTMFGAGAFYNFLNFNLGAYSRQNFRFDSFTTSFYFGYTTDIMDVHYVFDLSFTGKNYRGIATSSHEIGLVFKFATGEEK